MGYSFLLKHYIAKLCFRILVFGFIAGLYIFNPELLDFTRGFSLMAHIFLVILLVEMILQINPLNDKVSGGCLKQFGLYYNCPEEGYDKAELELVMSKRNLGALKVAVIWIIANIVIGLLYFKGIIGVPFLVALTAFYYISDLICVIIFCPFQKFFMHNRCCVNCRIFAWGLPMMITPLIFINSMESRVICIIAFAIAIRWEYVIKKHPERFWEGSNVALRCANCEDKMCKIKRPIKWRFK